MSCWQNCGIWLACFGPVWMNLSVVHSSSVRLVWPGAPYYEQRLLGCDSVYRRSYLSTRRQENSRSTYIWKVGIYLPNVSGLHPKRQQSRDCLVLRTGSNTVAGATVSTATPPSTAVSSVRDLTTVVCGSEFLAGCSRQDELATIQSCVQLSALEINWTWKSALTKILFPVLCTMPASSSAGNYVR